MQSFLEENNWKKDGMDGTSLTTMYLLSLSSISFCGLLYFICKLGVLSNEEKYQLIFSKESKAPYGDIDGRRNSQFLPILSH